MHNTSIHQPIEHTGAPSTRDKILAWSAHLFTATGVVWGLFSILAITRQAWIEAFVWMSIAIFVDSLDGFLARRLRVKEVLPGFDGELLDNVVDYLNYTFVPAFFLSQADLLPAPLAVPAAVLILLASAYQFCQSDAKTEDHFFTGFPSYWNITVLYMFFLDLNVWINLTLIVLLSVLVFVPIKFIYPSRTAQHQALTLALTIAWGISILVILATYPNQPPWLVWGSLLIFGAYYVGMSLLATQRRA
jgi:phosphatidylcholine synthase